MSVDALVQFVVNGMLNSMWIALLLALVTWTLIRALLKANAATRHVLWWAVLLLILLLPFRGLDQLTPARTRALAPHIAQTMVQEIQPAAVVPVPVARAVTQPVFPIQLNSRPWLPVVAFVWALFCLLHLVRIAVSYVYIRSIQRRSQPASPQLCDVSRRWIQRCGIRRSVRLLVSHQVASPLATGFLRPAIILPAQLAPQLEGQELDHVLLHELAHVARRDDWTNLAARTLASLVGLHPVAAWVLRQVERERELACDDWVVSMTGEARPYAASLARLFELCRDRRRMMLAAGMAGSGSRLGERIDTLLDRGREFTRSASLLRVAATIAVLAILAIAFRAPRWIMLVRPHPITAPRTRLAGFANLRPMIAPPIRPAVFFYVPPQPSFLAALAAAGYGNLSVDEIISFKSNGVYAGYLDALTRSKCPHMSVADIVSLVRSRVSVDYLSKMQNAGFKQLTIGDVINLHVHYVRPEAIAEIHALGFGPYGASAAIEFQRRGIPPEFFRSLHDAGFKQVDANGVIDAFTRGVRPTTLREVHQYKPKFTLEQIARLKQAGVLQ
jgi:beta-lactamase regulating signal transducer with metallopeptidase domain